MSGSQVEVAAAPAAWIASTVAGLIPDRGVAVLLPDGRQVAVFRTSGDGDGLYAVGNIDPFSGAAVMSRGIVGDRDGEPVVVSPMHKQVFSLRTGHCLDEPDVELGTFTVRERAGRIEVTD